jgi:hypothetical protein
MFNLYELFKKYNVEHLFPWEAYRLENNLTVKINPASDMLYPFHKGDLFQFVSHSTYRPGKELHVKNISDQVRDAFPPRVKSTGSQTTTEYEMYSSKIVEKINLVKVINLSDPEFNFEMLNFTLIGAPLMSELLVFMMQEIQRVTLKK